MIQSLAGITDSPDLAISSPPPQPDAVVRVEAESPASNAEETKFLRSLGLSKRGAQRLLTRGRATDYLSVELTARLLLVDEANSIEDIRTSQKKALQYARDKTIEPHIRCACLGVVAQLGQALARLCDITLESAKAMERESEESKQPVIKPVQNNYYGFPPVATESRRGAEDLAKTGGNDATEISATVK
jgi:hypothetical protein